MTEEVTIGADMTPSDVDHFDRLQAMDDAGLPDDSPFRRLGEDDLAGAFYTMEHEGVGFDDPKLLSMVQGIVDAEVAINDLPENHPIFQIPNPTRSAVVQSAQDQGMPVDTIFFTIAVEQALPKIREMMSMLAALGMGDLT